MGANQVSNEGSYNNISYSVVPNNYLLNKLWNRTIFRRDVHTSNKFFPKIYNTLLNYEYLCSAYNNINEQRKNKLKESINVLKMPMGNIILIFVLLVLINILKIIMMRYQMKLMVK